MPEQRRFFERKRQIFDRKTDKPFLTFEPELSELDKYKVLNALEHVNFSNYPPKDPEVSTGERFLKL